jgi:hypothetical protein
MLDFLLGRMGALLAAGLILVSLVGIMGAANSSFQTSQAEAVASKIASLIDGIGASPGATSSKVVFSNDPESAFPAKIAGSEYSVQILASDVLILKGGPAQIWSHSDLHATVLIAPPAKASGMTQSEYDAALQKSADDGLVFTPPFTLSVDKVQVAVGGVERALVIAHAS